MTTFDKREGTFESKFMHDQELKFKVHARRNKLIAKWASELMRYDSARTEQYVEVMLQTVVKENDDKEVITRISADFKAANITMEEAQIHKQLLLMEQQAQTEIIAALNK